MPAHRLTLDPIACEGRGLCLELLPELISSDDWGFPIVPGHAVPAALVPAARRAVAACPVLALRLVRDGAPTTATPRSGRAPAT